MPLKLSLCFVLVCFTLNCCTAQFKVVITNLNNKKEHELKLNETFYYGLNNEKGKYSGKLEAIAQDGLTIGGKKLKVSDIAWIDSKGRSPKKNTSQISRILLYFGGGMVGLSAYEYFEANDKKTANAVLISGAALALGSFCFWAFPKQPEFDFNTKYLMEIKPVITDKN